MLNKHHDFSDARTAVKPLTMRDLQHYKRNRCDMQSIFCSTCLRVVYLGMFDIPVKPSGRYSIVTPRTRKVDINGQTAR